MTKLASRPDHGDSIAVDEDGNEYIPSILYQEFFDDLAEKLNARLFGNQIVLAVYTAATLPPVPVVQSPGLIFVSDEIGGPVPAFSDGVNWRRCTDRVIVS